MNKVTIVRALSRTFPTLALLAFAITAFSQTPIAPMTWTGSPASAAGPSGFTTLPATTTPGAAVVAVSQWNRGAVVVNAAGGCYNSNNWQVGGSLAAAQAANKCVFFTVTNSATVELRVTRLFIRSQVSATGPQMVQMTCQIGATTTLFGPTIVTAHTASPEDWDVVDKVCIGPGQTATFRLYGWGATGSAGTLRINDNTAIAADFAPPISATASNTSPICAGEDLTLTGVVSGGVPGYMYSWAGPLSFSSTMLSPTITAAAAGAAGVYTLTVTDAMECSTSAVPVTTTVTVNTAPAPITGTAVVCPLLTTALTSASAGGTWTTSDAAIATVSTLSGIVTGVAPGTVTITYQLSSLCFTTRTVTVNTPPDPITGSRSVCMGLTTALASGPGGGTWSSSNTTVATTGPGIGIVNGVTAGTANITYAAPGGCIAVAAITVYPFPSAITGIPSVCIGATTTLSNPSAGGVWSSTNPAAGTVSTTGVVTGIAAGTTTISYTLGTSCASAVVVTVHPLPDAIGGITEVCSGHTQTLVNSTPGGTWSSSDLVVATVGSLTGTVLGGVAGTATITYRLTATGCVSAVVMTVNPVPAPITGPAAICFGTTANLVNASPGGTWVSGNTSVATIGSSTGVVSGDAAGTATISYIFASTGCYITRIQTVNPLPSPLSGPTNVCPGFTITLTSSPAGGTWTSSDAAIATVGAGSGIVTGVNPGTARITYTLPTTCRTTRVVTVDPAPPAFITPLGDTTFCPGDFVVLSANTGPGLSYQWFLGPTPIPGETSATYTAAATGSYRVRVTNSFTCPRFSAPMSVLVDAVAAGITVPGGVTTGCASSPIILNATAGAGFSYQWLLGGVAIPGATSASYAVGTSGNYTVRIVNVTGCSDESSPVGITINPSPSPVVTLSGPATVCAGGSVTLSAETGIGYTYQWHSAAGAIPGATGSTFTVTLTGSYYAFITNSFGCSINTMPVAVTVDALPDVGIALVGSRVFCDGGGVNLVASSSPAYTYQWYRGGLAIAGATGSTYYATAGGGYRVRVTNAVAGCTDITHADTNVVVISSPVIVPLTPARFCWGGSSLLATSVPAAAAPLVRYQWYKDGAAIPGATSATCSANVAASYGARITVPGSCTVTTTEVAVSGVPLPDPVITQAGSLLKTQTFYVAYQWYKNLVPIAGATTHTIAHSGAGNYKVMVTDTNGCQSVSANKVITGGGVTTYAGSPTVGDDIRLFPNPTNGLVYVANAEGLKMIVSAADGRTVASGQAGSVIDMSALASGIYLVRIADEEDRVLKIEKVVKQ